MPCCPMYSSTVPKLSVLTFSGSMPIWTKRRDIRNRFDATGRFTQMGIVLWPNIRSGHGAGRLILSRRSNKASAAWASIWFIVNLLRHHYLDQDRRVCRFHTVRRLLRWAIAPLRLPLSGRCLCSSGSRRSGRLLWHEGCQLPHCSG